LLGVGWREEVCSSPRERTGDGDVRSQWLVGDYDEMI
jgi:hypothetical protein